jgi:hypothetical protein
MNKLMKLLVTMILLPLLFTSCKNETKKAEIKNLYVKDKNIHIAFTDDKQKQITFNGSDDTPLLYKNKEQIIFVRTVKESGINRGYERKKLMIVSIDDFTERTITEKKPFKDGNDNSNEIFTIGNPTISIDSSSIYFTTEKWVTGNELVKVGIETRKWEELFATNQFEYITKGSHKGLFLITRSEIRDKGRASYHMLVDEQGIVKKEFENKTSADNFMKMIKNNR